MRYNVISYFINEGFRNVFKNKKSTFSCLGVMCATMFMFGVFFAIGQNVNNIVSEIEGSQAIRVFALQDATQEEIEKLGEEISQINGVNKIEFKTAEDAYNEVKEGLKDRPGVLDALEVSAFSASYIVTLTDLDLNTSVQENILKLDNVKRITSNNQTIEALSKVAKCLLYQTL